MTVLTFIREEIRVISIVLVLLTLVTLAVAVMVHLHQQKGSVTACAEVTSRNLHDGNIMIDYGPECDGLTRTEQDEVARLVADRL